MQHMHDAAARAKHAALGAAHAVEAAAEAAEHVRDTALGFAAEQHQRVAGVTHLFKDSIETLLKQKMQKQVERVVNMIPTILKEALDDPEMPRFIAFGQNQAIEAMWPDLKEEMMWQVAVILDADDKASEAAKGDGPDCIRAFLRYHIFPFNKTFWGKLKDPVFALFTFASLIPWVGMTPIMFFFIFLIIDKTDEYQLCTFILQFKGTQFVSHGIIRTIVGFCMYVHCVTVPARENFHTCAWTGPGVVDQMELVLAGWISQVVLIWAAFLILPYATDKGRTQLRGQIGFEHTESSRGAKAGGYFRNLMIYDMVCFLLCLGALIYVICTRPHMRHDEWVVKQAFFACQIVYGYSSVPFFFFTLPFLQAVLTHTVPTGYDRKGRCVKLEGPPKNKPPRTEMEEILTSEEADKLFEGMKHIAWGFGTQMRPWGGEAAAAAEEAR